jgi:hypothetical protein
VKRSALLLAIPLVLLAIWASAPDEGGTGATVRIVAEQPTELRSAVIATVRSHGGTRVGERTEYSDRGSSELRFTVPAARLEEAMNALGDLGGTVTSQQVDLSDAAAAAGQLTDGLAELDRCLGRVGASGTGATSMADCQELSRSLAARVRSGTTDLGAVPLVVRVDASGVSSGAMSALIIVLLVLAIVVAAVVWRTTRPRAAGDGPLPHDGRNDRTFEVDLESPYHHN